MLQNMNKAIIEEFGTDPCK